MGTSGVSGCELPPCVCSGRAAWLLTLESSLQPAAMHGVAVYSSLFQIPVAPLADVSVERRLREERGVKGARGEHTSRRISVPWKQKGMLLLRERRVRAEGM